MTAQEIAAVAYRLGSVRDGWDGRAGSKRPDPASVGAAVGYASAWDAAGLAVSCRADGAVVVTHRARPGGFGGSVRVEFPPAGPARTLYERPGHGARAERAGEPHPLSVIAFLDHAVVPPAGGA